MHRYILFYKPYGVLSQFSDAFASSRSDHASLRQRQGRTQTRSDRRDSENKRRTLKDYIPIPNIYPVGRLDWDSEGLMLLTDRGQVQHRLADPRFGHSRIYWAQVERIPDLAAIRQIEQGVIIENYRTRPAKVKLLEPEPTLPPRDPPIRYRKSVPTAWLELVLTEGKNRQVRRMTAKVGFPTLRLVRVAIAHLHLSDLQPGTTVVARVFEMKSWTNPTTMLAVVSL